jgi:aspartokinase
MWRQWFSCPVTLIASDTTMKIIEMSKKHSHSNLLLERKVLKIEDEKIKVAAIISTVTPRTILSEIAVKLGCFRKYLFGIPRNTEF